jgi:hypothetical protein
MDKSVLNGMANEKNRFVGAIDEYCNSDNLGGSTPRSGQYTCLAYPNGPCTRDSYGGRCNSSAQHRKTVVRVGRWDIGGEKYRLARVAFGRHLTSVAQQLPRLAPNRRGHRDGAGHTAFQKPNGRKIERRKMLDFIFLRSIFLPLNLSSLTSND